MTLAIGYVTYSVLMGLLFAIATHNAHPLARLFIGIGAAVFWPILILVTMAEIALDGR